MVALATEIPNWMAILVASAGGFVIGVSSTVALKAHVAISVGKKYVEVPRWVVVTGAAGGALSVICATVGLLASPSAIHLLWSGMIVVLVGVTGMGVVKSVG